LPNSDLDKVGLGRAKSSMGPTMTKLKASALTIIAKIMIV
jgi:hypothetical protein